MIDDLTCQRSATFPSSSKGAHTCSDTPSEEAVQQTFGATSIHTGCGNYKTQATGGAALSSASLRISPPRAWSGWNVWKSTSRYIYRGTVHVLTGGCSSTDNLPNTSRATPIHISQPPPVPFGGSYLQGSINTFITFVAIDNGWLAVVQNSGYSRSRLV